MVDYESNLIRPVKSLVGIAGLSPAKQREERKRRQQPDAEQAPSDQDAESLSQDKNEKQDDPDGTKIDYCA
jgi:hypothetical protein